jgi:hypothetical protein
MRGRGVQFTAICPAVVDAPAARRHLIGRIPEGERGELAGMLAALIDGGELVGR